MKEIKLYIYKFPESWREKMSKKEKATREYLQTLTKDRVIELCLQYIFDKNVVETQLEESFTEEDVEGLIEDRDKTIKFLQKEFAEKDKEIELLKHLGNHETATEMFKENAKLIIEKRQLAIQELEKVKVNLKDRISMMKNEEHSYLQKVVAWYDICDQVNKQIKELSGGRDGKF